MTPSRGRVLYVGRDVAPASLTAACRVEEVTLFVSPPSAGADESLAPITDESAPADDPGTAGAERAAALDRVREAIASTHPDCVVVRETAVDDRGDRCSSGDETAADCALAVPGPAVVETVTDAAPSVAVLYVTSDADGVEAGAVTRAGATEYLVDAPGEPSVTDRVTALVAADAPPTTADGSFDGGGFDDVYEAVVEAAEEGVFVLDETGRFALANEAVADLLDVDRSSVLGRSAADVIDPDRRAEWTAVIDALGAGERTSATVEVDVECDDGRKIPVEASLTRLREADRTPDGGYVGMIRDVSHRKRREKTVTRLLSSTRTLFACDTTAEIAATIADAAADVFGYECVAVHLLDPDAGTLVLEAATAAGRERFVDRERGDGYADAIGEAFRAREPAVEALDRADGDDTYEEAMYIPIDGDGVLTVCSPRAGAFDASAVELAQLLAATAAAAFEGVDRRETLVRYEQVLETVEGMVYALDEQGRFTLVTEPLADRVGYDRAELVGQHAAVVLDPEDVDQASACIRTLLADSDRSSVTWEANVQTAVGGAFPAEVEISLLPNDGDFAGTVGAVHDITERRERDRYLQVLNRVLRHNLRNDLTVVMGYADQLTQRVEDDALAETARMLREVSADLAALSEDAKHIERTLRRGHVEGHPIDLADLVTDVVERHRWNGRGATVDVDVPADAVVVADDELATALVHLVENAIEHNPDPDPHVRISATRDDRTVTLAVDDDGPGIPPSERAVITGDHDITQLTHGSGLGLWLVRWIVDSYGGRIDFDTADLGGSRVEIVLEAAAPLAS